MGLPVLLTDDAAHDLDELYDHIARHDATENADYVLGQIEKAFSSLSESPERGAYPKELLTWASGEYREIFFNPTHHLSGHRRRVCT
jgi:toxin ParE1/3/4